MHLLPPTRLGSQKWYVVQKSIVENHGNTSHPRSIQKAKRQSATAPQGLAGIDNEFDTFVDVHEEII